MARNRLIAVLAVALAGCASSTSQGQDTSAPIQTRAVLRSSEVANAKGARYDRSTGRCSSGSQQLMDDAEFRQRIECWRSSSEDCIGVSKSSVPSTAGYPSLLAKLQRSGSAQVLVRLEADGTVESTRAVCATDSAFGEAAEATARAIKYAPATCDAKRKRSAFLVPFDYSF